MSDIERINEYYEKKGVVPKRWRTIKMLSTIMLNSALIVARNDSEFLEFLVSSKREINAFINHGRLPKKVKSLLG